MQLSHPSLRRRPPPPRTVEQAALRPEEQKVACRAAGERRAVSNRGGHAGHLAQRRREERPLAARMGRARWGECARHPRHAEQLGVEGARVVRARRLDFGRGQIPGEGRAVRWPTGRARRPGCGRENWRPRRGDALLPPGREQPVLPRDLLPPCHAGQLTHPPRSVCPQGKHSSWPPGGPPAWLSPLKICTRELRRLASTAPQKYIVAVHLVALADSSISENGVRTPATAFRGAAAARACEGGGGSRRRSSSAASPA